jgi:hypothetical protein
MLLATARRGPARPDAARPGPDRPSAALSGAAGRKSALPDPVEQRLGRGLRRRLMLAVAPGAARAFLVVTLAARDADHALSIVQLFVWCLLSWCLLSCGARGRAVLVIVRCSRSCGACVRAQQKRPRPYERCSRFCHVDVAVWRQARTRLVRAGPQAAFARRMRRRRSAERSSSFKPPHVPYFSGRETA